MIISLNGARKTTSILKMIIPLIWLLTFTEVESCKIPGGDLLRIEHHADVQYHKFNNWLDSLPERKQYGYLLDRVTHEDFMRVIHMNNNIIDKIAYLKSKFYQTH